MADLANLQTAIAQAPANLQPVLNIVGRLIEENERNTKSVRTDLQSHVDQNAGLPWSSSQTLWALHREAKS